MHRRSAVPYPVGICEQHSLEFLPVQMLPARFQVQSYPTRTKVMEFYQLAIRHRVWVDADYCAAPFIQLNEGVLDRSIVCMIDGKCFFYPSTAAPEFCRGLFPCMGMVIAAGVFALGNSMALQYSNLQRNGRIGSRRKEFRWMLVNWADANLHFRYIT
jgi:hypothetical protein